MPHPIYLNVCLEDCDEPVVRPSLLIDDKPPFVSVGLHAGIRLWTHEPQALRRLAVALLDAVDVLIAARNQQAVIRG